MHWKYLALSSMPTCRDMVIFKGTYNIILYTQPITSPYCAWQGNYMVQSAKQSGGRKEPLGTPTPYQTYWTLYNSYISLEIKSKSKTGGLNDHMRVPKHTVCDHARRSTAVATPVCGLSVQPHSLLAFKVHFKWAEKVVMIWIECTHCCWLTCLICETLQVSS